LDFKIPIFTILGIFLVFTFVFDQVAFAHNDPSHDACYLVPSPPQLPLNLGCSPIIQAPRDVTVECNAATGGGLDPFGDFKGKLQNQCVNEFCPSREAAVIGDLLGDTQVLGEINAHQGAGPFGCIVSDGVACHPFFPIKTIAVGPKGCFLGTNCVDISPISPPDASLTSKDFSVPLSDFDTVGNKYVPREVKWVAVVDAIPFADTDLQKVTVRDTIPPSFTSFPADTILEAQVPKPYCSDGSCNRVGTPRSTDLCSSFDDLVTSSSDVSSDDPDPQTLEVITRTWKVQDVLPDGKGGLILNNEISADQIIIFQDTTPPVLTVPSDMIVKCNFLTCAFGIGQATANDLVDTNPTITNDDPGVFPQGITVVTWTAIDASTNQAASVEQIITVVPDDDDGDGIVRLVDTLPTVFSDDFDDVPIGGETEGVLKSRGDQDILILEETNPDGIFFDVDGGGGVTPGLIVACDEAGELEVDSGDSGTITCGSITVSIISGSVDVQFNTGGFPATTTMVTTNSLMFDDDTLIITNNSMTDDAVFQIGNITITLAPGESINITPFAFPPTSKTSYQDPNLGDVRHGEGHDNGFCMNQNCMNVDGFFNHFPETIVPQGSTQTFSLLINCPRGVNTCNHASIEGVLPDSDFYEEQWGVTLDRVPGSNSWETTINNPYGEIGEVTTTVQEVGQSFLAVSFNIEFLIPGSIGTADGIRVAHENNRFLHVTVWDSNRGISNYVFNEGVYVDDIYAYPKVETSYDAPLEIEKLCLNENPNKRYTCAFDKVREWTIKNAEKALLEIEGITELDVLNEEFLSKFKELKQAIADEDSEKISELKMQLDELGIKIHNMKQ